MFLVNGFQAKLIQYNRNGKSLAYDDEDTQEVPIKIIPYNADDTVVFGTYTEPGATGSYMVRREVDIKEGDQIIFNDRTHTVVKLADKWIFNRIEYKVVFVKWLVLMLHSNGMIRPNDY